MDLEVVVARRRMRRRWSGEALPAQLIERLLRLALTAPSAGHAQAVDWLVLSGAEERRRFFEAATEPSFRAAPGSLASLFIAPAILLPTVDPAGYERRYAQPDKAASGLAGVEAAGWPVPYWTVDVAFAVMILLLGAEEAGLAALFFRLHRPVRDVLDALGVPPGRQAIGALALGWPDQPPSPPTGATGRPSDHPRHTRAFADRVHWGSW